MWIHPTPSQASQGHGYLYTHAHMQTRKDAELDKNINTKIQGKVNKLDRGAPNGDFSRRICSFSSSLLTSFSREAT